MSIEEQLDQLVMQFQVAFPNAIIGRGPSHPSAPDPELTDITDDFLRTHSHLARDPGYVAFLKRYSGLLVNNPSENEIIVFGGLSSVAVHLLDPDMPSIVDEDGFFSVGWSEYSLIPPITWETRVLIGFSIDATLERASGVYRFVRYPRQDRTISTLYLPSFLVLLERLISLRGRLLD
ncbi:MAG: hypothetical protein ACRC8S_11765 [Fimbriiglobus sp.]